MATVSNIRIVGLMLQQNIDELYNSLSLLYAVSSAWICNQIDDDLPAEGEIKSTLDEYSALKIPRISAYDAIQDIAQSTGTPPEGLFYLPARVFPLIFEMSGYLLAGQLGSQAMGTALTIERVTMHCENTGTGGDDLQGDVKIDAVSILNNPLVIPENSGFDAIYIAPAADLLSIVIAADDVLSVEFSTVPTDSKGGKIILWVRA